MNRSLVLDQLRNHMSELNDRFHVHTLGLFGSFAREGQSDTSDIDLVVSFTSPISFFQFLRLEMYLEQILNRKIDLVSEDAIKPWMRSQIMREVIYVNS